MAAYNYGPTLSGAGGFVGGYSAAAPVGAPAFGGYGAQQVPGAGYGSLAGYGASRVAPPVAQPYYQPQSYSTSLSADALAYGSQAGAYQPRQSQYSGPVLSGLPAASSYGGVSGGIEQYGGANLAPQIEAAYEAAALHRRQPVVRRQVIQVPGNPGQVKQIVRRVPTPIPDVIERVFVVKPQRDVVNLVIERPTTPPPQVKNRTIVAKARKPVIHSHVVRVPPRSIQAPQQQVQQVQQVQVQVQPPPVQYAAPQYVPPVAAPAPAPAQGYAYGSGYSYSSTESAVYPGGAVPQYGGFSTGYPANYGLPAYGGAVSYSQPAYNYGYAQPASYPSYAAPAAYGTSSVAYSNAYAQQPSVGAAYPSIIAANPAGNAYYGVGYPSAAGYPRF